MDIAINDLSFKGQFTSDEQIEHAFEALLLTTETVKGLKGNTPICRTEGLKNRYLTQNDTIHSYLHCLFLSPEPAKRALQNKILITLIRGPYIQEQEFDARFGALLGPCGESMGSTSLQAYVSRYDDSVHGLVSIQNSPYDSLHEISINPGVKKPVLIFNFISPACFSPLQRKYDANPKHDIRQDKVVNGVVYSRMDLAPQEAERCLMNGMQVLESKCVYGYTNGQWYAFPPHLPGIYHGYPVGNPANHAEINRIKRVFGLPPYAPKGSQFCFSS